MLRHFLVATLCLPSVGLFSSAEHQAAPAAATTRPVEASGVIRIKAGLDRPLTDKSGNVWQKDTGFVDGDVVDRSPDLAIEGTDTPELYRTEHYDMTRFALEVPNGKYTVRMHFAETFEGVTKVGERVFSFDVEGQPVKDFDVMKEAGGKLKALIKTFEVEVKDGKLDITFAAKEQAPMVNAIEIAPKK